MKPTDGRTSPREWRSRSRGECAPAFGLDSLEVCTRAVGASACQTYSSLVQEEAYSGPCLWRCGLTQVYHFVWDGGRKRPTPRVSLMCNSFFSLLLTELGEIWKKKNQMSNGESNLHIESEKQGCGQHHVLLFKILPFSRERGGRKTIEGKGKLT